LSPYGLDAPGRKPELVGASATVIQDAAFSLQIANANPVLSLAHGDLPYDLHPPDEELQELVVELVERPA